MKKSNKVRRIFLWKTPLFLWKTWGEHGDKFSASGEKNPATSRPVEKSALFPQVFHSAKIAERNVCSRFGSVFHIFHRPYYDYFK